MNLRKRFARLWVWFTQGWAVSSIFISIGNTGMMLITMLTVKGIYIPLWMIVIFVGFVILGILGLGYKWFRLNVQADVQSYLNTDANPEWNEKCRQLDRIEKMLLENK